MKPELEAAIREEILKRIPMARLKVEDQEGLRALDLRILFSRFFNWQNRHVSSRRRNVHLSGQLVAKNRPEVQPLADKIENGSDLTPHLSRRIDTVFITNPKQPELDRRADLDLLLNDWGIFHLHISQILESDGYAKRGRELLMVIFKRNDAYLLDLLDHDSWTKESLVETAVTDWPGAKLFTVMPGMKLYPPGRPEIARTDLRNSAINTPVELPMGLVFGPGMSRAGTSGIVEVQINQFWNKIALDEPRCSVAQIIDAIQPGLAYHPFSDRV